jgi:5-carboxymethyl-2-hydroxymuconic-semialdehyde dehydrogenase
MSQPTARVVAAAGRRRYGWVNSHDIQDLPTPFGGLKESGNCREGGHYSIDCYTELKTEYFALATHRISKLCT